MTMERSQFVVTGRHVLFAMLAFFGTLIAVQAAFVTIAISTHTGVVSKQPYRKGLDYGERIKAEKRQKDLGWTEALEHDAARGKLALSLKGPDGQPISGLGVSGLVGRPATMSEDRSLTFSHDWQNDSYVAELPAEMQGAYIVDLQAVDTDASNDVIWRMRKRLWIKP